MNVSPIRNEGDIQNFKEAAPNERGKKTGKNRKISRVAIPGGTGRMMSGLKYKIKEMFLPDSSNLYFFHPLF